MNLRQKAKYYKKRCEMLEDKLPSSSRVSFDYIKQPIVSLYSEQHLSLEEYVAMMQASGDIGLAMIKKNMERDFMNQLLNYAQVIAQEDKKSGYIVIKARMKVVDISKKSQEVNNGNN